MDIIDKEEFAASVDLLMGCFDACPRSLDLGRWSQRFADLLGEARRRGSFDEGSFLVCVEGLVGAVKDRVDDPQIAHLLLSLSRFHCDVRAIIEKEGLFATLAPAAVAYRDRSSVANRVFIGDLIFSHYTWLVEETFDKSGYEAGKAVLLGDSYLSTAKGQTLADRVLCRLVDLRFSGDREMLKRLAADFAHFILTKSKIGKRLALESG